jgi:hypothetical protein
VEILDHTAAAPELWTQAGEATLRGLFLKEMRRMLDTATEEEQASLHMALRFGLAALDGRDI